MTNKIVKNCPLDKNAVLLRSKILANLMQQARLKEVKTNFILFTPFDKAFFQKLDRKLGWFPLGRNILFSPKNKRQSN